MRRSGTRTRPAEPTGSGADEGCNPWWPTLGVRRVYIVGVSPRGRHGRAGNTDNHGSSTPDATTNIATAVPRNPRRSHARNQNTRGHALCPRERIPPPARSYEPFLSSLIEGHVV